MSALIEFLNQPWVQALFWAMAALAAVRFITLPEIAGGGSYWRTIGIGILLYGLRVSFKLMPFYSKEVVWSQVMRYSIGILAGFFILFGFVEYYYTNLRTIIKMKEEA